MEPPRAFEVEVGPSWARWVKVRTAVEMDGINARLQQLQASFGQPHIHAGLGLRRLTPRLFEFRISKGISVVFAFIKPRTFQLAMTGTHNEVQNWLKQNL
jgi:hypothetical protein